MTRINDAPVWVPRPISPVPEGSPRPLWSVMIPTFNCAQYLRLALESVLAQDPGPEYMQIEVVDDFSAKDDPEAVVREVGKGRVAFYRQSKNVGSFQNFNTCIERSRGHLVHILHGDDWILPGFYQAIDELSKSHPAAALLATRCFFADQDGWLMGITKRLPGLEISSHDLSGVYLQNPFQFAGVVIRRSFYEKYGGFLEGLIHVADWELYARAIHLSGAAVSPKVLGCYRVFANNASSRQKRTALNLLAYEQLIDIFSVNYPDFPRHEAMRKQLYRAREQEREFIALKDFDAASASHAYWSSRIDLPLRIRWALISFLRALPGGPK